MRKSDTISPVSVETKPEFDKMEKELFNSRNRFIALSTQLIAAHALSKAFKEPQNFVRLVLAVSINETTMLTTNI